QNTGLVLTVQERVPVLLVNHPAAVCTPALVDLTAPAVTAGSDGGLTYEYFMDEDALHLIENPAAISQSGIYYIRGRDASGRMTEIKAVTVTIHALPEIIISTDRNPELSKGETIQIFASWGLGFVYSWADDNGVLAGQ